MPRSVVERARNEGTHTLDIPPSPVKIHGNPTPEQIERIRTALEKLPPQMRQHAREIFLTDNLGDIYGNPPERMWGLSGLSDYPGGILLDRIALQEQGSFENLFYHEMGHNADAAFGHPSSRHPFGVGSSSSPYGERNGMEDFAEIHSLVLQNLNDLGGLQRRFPDLAEKIRAIMKLYELKATLTPGGPRSSREGHLVPHL